ncbi:MAG TPA: hypothetical protein VF384_09495 [Planctomycetota bacterium]
MPTQSTLRHLLACLLAAAAAAQSPFTIGNLVVVRIGDGVTPLGTAATATFLDEYTTGGVLVQSVAMPIAASGTNLPFTNSGSTTSEGFLNVSTNGFFLLLGGYGATPGTLTIAQTASATTPRVIARIDLLGNLDTSTALSDAYSGSPTNNSPLRSVASDTGFRFWTSGTGGGTSAGIRFVANVGDTTSLGLNAGAPTNTRTATIYNGQLYTTSASTVYQGVAAVGTGLPTSPSQPITLLNGFPTASGPSAYDHFFANPTTLYVADDRTGGSGGIQKWTLSGGVWTLQYTLSLSPVSGCRGLTGFVQNGVVTLWATANQAFPSVATELVTVVDAGPGSVVTSIAVAGTNTAFRGLRHLAMPTTLQRFPLSCGAMDILVTGNGQIGTDVITTIQNPLGFGFIGYGLTGFVVPFCNCTIGHDYVLLLLGPSHTLSVPYDPTLFGTQLFMQGLDFLAPGGCPDPMFTLTDAYSLTIQ